MDDLRELVGVERSLASISEALHLLAVRLRPQSVGAMHITCSDESETECINAFQRGFVQLLLPPLKFAQQSAFRISNLGGRYEWGAVRIAEQHFKPAKEDGGFKLLLIKVNAHVALHQSLNEQHFGVLERYGTDSPCCGAIHQLLEGSEEQPFIQKLRELFESEGKSRLAILKDPQQVELRHRALCAAIVSARLQARAVLLDIQDYEVTSPTLYLVIPCVTINRPERDTEIVCGYYHADDRDDSRSIEYFGLGDDPSGFTIDLENNALKIMDTHLRAARPARDHRKMVLDRWGWHRDKPYLQINDERLERIARDVVQNKQCNDEHAKGLLRAMLSIASETIPVPAAVLLFAHGCVGIQHVFHAYDLANEIPDYYQARRILREIEDRVDHIDMERIRAMMELLVREYRP